LHTPMLEADGCVTVPEVPGIGCEPNVQALAAHRTAEIVIDSDKKIHRRSFGADAEE
jgi:hypothetical protein